MRDVYPLPAPSEERLGGAGAQQLVGRGGRDRAAIGRLEKCRRLELTSSGVGSIQTGILGDPHVDETRRSIQGYGHRVIAPPTMFLA